LKDTVTTGNCPWCDIVSGEGFISKCVNAESGTGVGIVEVEAAPPPDVCPDVWLFETVEVEPPDDDPLDVEESAPVGVPVDRFEPVGEAVVEALLTVLFWLFSDVVLLEAEPSCVPCVVEEFAVDEAVSVVTELAAEVFLPDVDAAAPEVAVVATP
jgi:hypothetical protein